jgi:hypothetical protein
VVLIIHEADVPYTHIYIYINIITGLDRTNIDPGLNEGLEDEFSLTVGHPGPSLKAFHLKSLRGVTSALSACANAAAWSPNLEKFGCVKVSISAPIHS